MSNVETSLYSDRTIRRRKGVRYVRFMDDLLILARTRWQLKRAIAEMNRWFGEAGLEQHPDKTFIGRIEHGFDWLGYRLGKEGLTGIALPSIEKFAAKFRRLLEQALRNRASDEVRRQRVAEYIRRWRSCFGLAETCDDRGTRAVWLGYSPTVSKPWISLGTAP